ncbi:hypothetical protein MNBD_GAMMA14-1741 [hydrothermal vent metagenome]|uniref:DUF6998 domain-containing protein n=1 Tax=hydrothermal vent metagenome TaxID=652676 RepID=A0A3B0Z9S0_9ZZZZ
MGVYSVDKLISEARRLAAEFRRTTGKPLPGVSGEIAEHDAARLLDLELCKERPGGYDAIGRGRREGDRVQIKGRVIFDEEKSGQRIGQLKLDKDWDSVVLVIMDENYEAVEIYEATREEVEDAMSESASSNRKKRGAMTVARFRIISRLVWARDEGVLDDEVRDNRSDT